MDFVVLVLVGVFCIALTVGIYFYTKTDMDYKDTCLSNANRRISLLEDDRGRFQAVVKILEDKNSRLKQQLQDARDKAQVFISSFPFEQDDKE